MALHPPAAALSDPMHGYWNFMAGAIIIMFIIFITSKDELGTYIQLFFYTAPANAPPPPASAGAMQPSGTVGPTPPAGAVGPGVAADRRTTAQFTWDKLFSWVPFGH